MKNEVLVTHEQLANADHNSMLVAWQQLLREEGSVSFQSSNGDVEFIVAKDFETEVNASKLIERMLREEKNVLFVIERGAFSVRPMVLAKGNCNWWNWWCRN